MSVMMIKPVLKNKSLQMNQTYKLHKIINYKVFISFERTFGIKFNTTNILQEVLIDLDYIFRQPSYYSYIHFLDIFTWLRLYTE